MLSVVLALSLATCTAQGTKEQIKSDFKQAGKNVAEATRPPRMAIKKAAKEVGHGFKKGGKAVGKGVKEAAKSVAKGTKQATQNLKK